VTTIPHEVAHRRRPELFVRRDVWASMAISTMWLAVLFDAVFGPDIVSTSGPDITRVPSAIVVALFAWLGSAVVARYAFGARYSERT
jgi:hypothetical protein